MDAWGVRLRDSMERSRWHPPRRAACPVIVSAALALWSPNAGGGQSPSVVFVANVADASTSAPLRDAVVVISDLARSGRTDWIGEARLAGLPRGRHTVTVRHIGHVPATVEIAFTQDTVGYVFMLAPSPPVLDTVRTNARVSVVPPELHDFEMRRAMGIGRFLTDSVLQKERTQPIASIMSRHFPGVYSAFMDRSVLRRNCDTRGAAPPRDGRPDVYIDGVRYGLTEPPGGSRSSVPPADALDLRFINGDDVAGVEYYTELSAPAQYRRPGMVCGVVLIWLRP